MDHQLSSRKRVRDESYELEINSPEVKRLKENLLDDLYELSTPSHDLDSFMQILEEEITTLPLSDTTVITSESGESQPELGYLLEASDDELGLPPPTRAETELVRVVTASNGLSNEFWPSYDSFDLGVVELDNYSGSIGEYVGLDGLFDHSDLGFGSGDFLWRPETLPAQ
ncbi:hypothetical protein K7X08_006713 [Anisodus acutangulus]|uniref:Uncharacterized protein n=1 Tax=Anisodus acutangulus TaxID=402998 RepID=A0A9Q1N1X5_9SOLA|nr:hypothetical protein K7X08_006713 [Anisodus acutangulus]